MILTLDIETLPTEKPEVIERIAGKIKPPGTLKKQESIDKWHAEEKENAIREAVNKTGLSGIYGSALCVGYKIDDNKAEVILESTEKETLQNFAEKINSLPTREIFGLKTVGHNLINFDLRFLFQRFCINGIAPPSCLPFHAKPWDKNVFDTMMMFAGVGNFVSLDDLCFAFGIESSKGDLDGSKVFEYYKAGKIEEIKAYCADDVEKTYQVFQRMNFGVLQ